MHRVGVSPVSPSVAVKLQSHEKPHHRVMLPLMAQITWQVMGFPASSGCFPLGGVEVKPDWLLQI